MKLLLMSMVSFCFLMQGLMGAESSAKSINVTIQKPSTSVIPKADADNFITSQVRVALRADSAFTENNIQISTADRVVTLKGEVADENSKKALGDMAAAVQGVKAVKNELTVKKVEAGK